MPGVKIPGRHIIELVWSVTGEILASNLAVTRPRSMKKKKRFTGTKCGYGYSIRIRNGVEPEPEKAAVEMNLDWR